MVLARVPPAGVALSLAVLIAVGAGLPSSAAAARRSALTPSEGNAEILSDALTAQALRYLGLRTVTTPGGSIDVMQFAYDGATASKLTVRTACADGVMLVESGPGTVTMTGSSIDATSLSAVVAGVPVTFTAAAPPTLPFPDPVELDQLTMRVTSLASARVELPGMTVGAVAC